jgi:hypothetical protein
MLLDIGASEASAGSCGGGAPQRFAGVGPRETNQIMLIESSDQPHCPKLRMR